VSELKNKKILGFCGIGNPYGFRQTLRLCGCEIREFLTYPDHHHYCENDLRHILDLAQVIGVEYVVCTLKDFVKVKNWGQESAILSALIIETEAFSEENDALLWERLREKIKI